MAGKWTLLRLARFAAGSCLGILLCIWGMSGAEAGSVTPANVNGVQHFFDCFGVMIHDGAEHAQYCAPGSNAPSNSSLGSFSGGTVISTCPTEGSIASPKFKAYDVAVLGNGWEEPARPRTSVGVQVADHCSCVPCDEGSSSLDAPLFAPFLTASLDDQLDAPAAKATVHRMLLACCRP